LFLISTALLVLSNFHLLNAQLILDSIIIEKVHINHKGFLAQWNHIFSSTLHDEQYTVITGLTPGDISAESDWARAEQALRASQLFSSIAIETDTLDQRTVQLFIKAHQYNDINSAGIDILSGGGNSSLGAFSKTGIISGDYLQSFVRIRHRTENSIGNECSISAIWHNAIVDKLSVEANFLIHRYTSNIGLGINHSFNPQGGLGYGVFYQSSHGIDFVYGAEQPIKKGFSSNAANAWAGWLLPRKDNLYITMNIGYQKANREDDVLMRRAFDNTSHFLLGFSSLADRSKVIDGQDIPTGAWGTAILGRIFPNNTIAYYYVAGLIEQSSVMMNDKLYLCGSLAAASGLNTGSAANTALEFKGTAHYMINRGLIIALHAEQKTAWNWEAFRQQVLDNDIGIRGMQANSRIGDNRIVSSLEFRHIIMESIHGIGLAFTLFADAGTVWSKGVSLFSTQWSTTIGAGVIILPEHAHLRYDKPLIRIDYAFGLDDALGRGIIVSTNYSFDLIKRHRYMIPQLIGTNADTE